MDKTKVAVAVFDKFAQEYQDKYMHVDLYDDTFDQFCDNIARPNADILELACGPGNITQYLLKKRPDYRIMGIDLSPNMIALAKTNNPGADFQVMDCRDIGRLRQQYDGIMCGFCLPYLSQEESVQLIRDAAGLIKPGGVIYISTMEENDDHKSGLHTSSSGDQIYIHYHRADYLIQALRENDFTILDVLHQDYPTTDGTKTVDLLILARKDATT